MAGEPRVLLEALEPGRYHATGAYHSATAPITGLPVEWDGTLSHQTDQIILEGKYRHHVGTAEHPFRLVLNLPSGLLQQGSFELHSPHLGPAAGTFRALGGGVVFGGRVDQSRATMSLNVEVLQPGVLDGKGTVVFPNGIVWLYHFEVRPTESRLAKADVVGIHQRRA